MQYFPKGIYDFVNGFIEIISTMYVSMYVFKSKKKRMLEFSIVIIAQETNTYVDNIEREVNSNTCCKA